MLFEVRRQRCRGRPLPKQDRQFAKAVIGDLHIEEQRADAFGRLMKVATLYASNEQSGTSESAQLYDAQLLWMSPIALVLGGLELQGDTAYAQTWLCLPVLPGQAGLSARGEHPVEESASDRVVAI